MTALGAFPSLGLLIVESKMNSVVRAFSFVMIFLLFSGCASMKYNYRPTSTNMDFPELNTVTTVNIGDKMLNQGKFSMVDVLEVSSPAGGACYDIPKGRYYKTGYDSSNTYYQAHGSGGAVQKSALCDPISGMFTKNDSPGRVCVLTIFGGYACYDTAYKEASVPSLDDESRQMTLIYSGRVGNIIKFTYSERYKNVPSYSHNVEYDISTTKVIGYKGAKIEIVESTNEQIKYVVLATFPWRQE